MYLQIELNEDLIEAIKAGTSRTLTCKVSVKEKQKRGRKKKVIEISKFGQTVITYWNNHPKRNILVGNRNIPFDDTQMKEVTRIEEAIDKMGCENVQRKIDVYQEQCSSGGYLKHDRNLAYKTLGSFCTALLKGTIKWWGNTVQIKDEDPDLTYWIADCFAERYLSRHTYGLNIGTKDYENFYKTHKVLDRIQKVGYNEEESLIVLFKCIDSNYGDKTIHPGTLSCDNTVKVLLPQYLKKIGN